MNKENQKKDQFEELLQMKQLAVKTDQNENMFNILEHIPKKRSESDERKSLSASKQKQEVRKVQTLTRDVAEDESLQLSEDSQKEEEK